MQYVLGNMLNGGGINPDGLSLDLQFAADKTLTARRGPTPVFTRGSTGTFVGSNGLIQTAAIDIPRFDHDPVTLACRGLLIEEGRTNLYQQSEVFNDSFWTKTRSSISSNATTAPDGTLTADKLVEDTTASNTHTIQSTVTPPATAHTLSVFAKKGERTWIVLRLGGTNTFFNLDDGTIAAGSVNSPTITNFGNGWYRCAVTSSLGTQGQFWLATNSTTTSYTGDGTSGLFIWGAQLEAGSFPTSYIPTTTAPLTRGADVCSITGGNFTGMWNQSEGTLLAQTQKTSTNSNAFIISVSDNSFNNETDLRYNSVSQVASLMNVSNVNQLVGLQANITSGAAVKQSIAYKLNDCAYAANGASPISDTSALIPTVDRLTIGNVAVAGQAFYLNGTIAAIRYYKKRLPNAKLAQLTA
jgi:hypothetical protein